MSTSSTPGLSAQPSPEKRKLLGRDHLNLNHSEPRCIAGPGDRRGSLAEPDPSSLHLSVLGLVRTILPTGARLEKPKRRSQRAVPNTHSWLAPTGSRIAICTWEDT